MDHHVGEDLRWLPDVMPALRAAAAHGAASRGPAAAMVVQDARGEIVAANRAAESLLGLSWRQLVGLTSTDRRRQAVSEEGGSLPGERHPALVALATGRPVLGFLIGVLVPPDDRTVWLELDAEPLPVIGPETSRPGPVCGVIVFFTDVSTSARGRRAFENLLRVFRMLADNASDIVVRCDTAGRCEWVSPSVEALTGWRPSDLIGRNVLDLIHHDDVATVVAHREQVLAGSEQHCTVRMAQQDGSFRWVSACSRSHPPESTAARSTVISMRDVDDAVRTRTRLAASERHHRMLIQNLTDIVVRVRDGVVAWISPSVEDVLGLRPDQFIGRDFDANLLREDRFLSRQAAVDLAGGQATRFRVRLRAADHAVHWFDVRGRPFHDNHGSLDGTILALRDVTDDVVERRRPQYLAEHDEPTGLVDRQEFGNRLRGILALKPRTGYHVGVMQAEVADLAAFRGVHGEEAGDRLLREVADRIVLHVRSSDLVARAREGEIVIVLDGVHGFPDVLDVADKLRLSVAHPYRVADTWIAPSLDIGACLAWPGESVEVTLRRAAEAQAAGAEPAARTGTET